MSRKKDIAAYVFITIAAIVFLMIFSRGTSPLYPGIYTNDSTIFMYIGRAMKYGYVPYRDMYDTKGPVMWLIQYIGQLIYEGRNGIFIIEIITFSAAMVLTNNIARRYLKIWQSLIVVLISMIFIGGSFDNGNSVEQYSYLCSMIALYTAVNATENGVLKRHFIIYGITAMCAMLIRLTDCYIAGACIIYTGIRLIREKRIRELITGFAITLASFIAVLMPFVIYYAANNALYDMIDATLLFSIRYADFNKIYSIRRMLILLFPLIASAYCSIKHKSALAVLLLVMTVTTAAVYAVIGTTYSHYMISAVPCVALAAVLVIERTKGVKPGYIALAAVMLCCVNYVYMRQAADGLLRVVFIGSSNQSAGFAEDIDGIIGDVDRDSVYSYYSDNMIQFRNNTHSRSKYFISQIPWSRDAGTKDKIYDDFVSGNNKWVITNEYNMEKGDLRIAEILNSNYTLVYSRDNYLLYERKEQQ